MTLKIRGVKVPRYASEASKTTLTLFKTRIVYFAILFKTKRVHDGPYAFVLQAGFSNFLKQHH